MNIKKCGPVCSVFCGSRKKTGLEAYQQHLLTFTIVGKTNSNKTLVLLGGIRFNDAIDSQGLMWHGSNNQTFPAKVSTCAAAVVCPGVS